VGGWVRSPPKTNFGEVGRYGTHFDGLDEADTMDQEGGKEGGVGGREGGRTWTMRPAMATMARRPLLSSFV